ncbi:peptidylprolyl isomerase, partial [Haematococcus lacustris]
MQSTTSGACKAAAPFSWTPRLSLSPSSQCVWWRADVSAARYLSQGVRPVQGSGDHEGGGAGCHLCPGACKHGLHPQGTTDLHQRDCQPSMAVSPCPLAAWAWKLATCSWQPLSSGRATCMLLPAGPTALAAGPPTAQDPTYGYGEAGSFSFPAVPPGARLTYELECVDFEEAEDEDGESSGNLMYEERLERAEKRRLTGNQLFAEGKYREAMGKYATALSYLDEDFMMQLEGFYEDKANEVKVPIHLNMAACQLRIKDYHTAVYNCSEVLKLQPGNVKALFRRGTARHALGQTEGAKADLTAAAEKSPDDKAIRAELQALRQTLRAEREAEATLFKGQFKFADPKPSTVGTQEEQQVHSSQDTAQPGSGSSHPALPLVAQPASLLSRALAGLWG